MKSILSAFLLLGAAMLTLSAANISVTFDEFTSPPVTCCYSDTGVTGPLVYPNVTIQDGNGNGYVMNGSGWQNMQTSGDNLFGTGSGSMVLMFNSGVSNFSVDVINGTGASDFTLSLFGPSENLIYTTTFGLANWGTAGSVLTVASGTSGVWEALISGDSDFAIDTLSFDTTGSQIPEPASLLLIASGFMVLGLARRRRA